MSRHRRFGGNHLDAVASPMYDFCSTGRRASTLTNLSSSPRLPLSLGRPHALLALRVPAPYRALQARRAIRVPTLPAAGAPDASLRAIGQAPFPACDTTGREISMSFGIVLSGFCVVLAMWTTQMTDLSTQANAALARRCGDGADGVRVRAAVEEHTQREGTWVVGIRFDIEIDGSIEPKYTFGSVGVGTSRGDAEQTALDEWGVLFVGPFCDARREAEGGIAFRGAIAYASPMGLRGSPPGGWVDGTTKMHEQVLQAVWPSVPTGAGTATVDLKAAVGAGPPKGECRVNGKMSTDCLTHLLALKWPAGTYMFKQYYVIRR